MTGAWHCDVSMKGRTIVSQTTNPVMGHAGSTAKAPGHWVLARLGKKVLRPGGIELSRQMLNSLGTGELDDVVEFAPGLGATAKMTLRRTPRSYVAVERDDNAARTVRLLLTGPNRRCIVGRAEDTGLPDACATIVYGEAMLTMQSATAKDRIVGEAARLLRPRGRYGIHEMAFGPEAMSQSLIAQISDELSGAIHHAVMPLTVGGWRSLFEGHGFMVLAEHTAPMHLLEPRRLLADEGLAGALRFAWNLLHDKPSRERVKQMKHVFRKYREHLLAVAIVSQKRDPTL